MTISLKHTTQSTKPASARAGDIDGPIWNEEHTMTMATGNVLGRTSSGDGAVEEVSYAALAAAMGVITTDGVATLTNKTITSAAFSGTQTGDFTTTGTITSNGTIAVDSSANAIIQLDKGGSGSSGVISFKNAGVDRWWTRGSDDAEGGSDTGTNYQILRFNDAGTFQDVSFDINRATGNVTIANDLTTNGNITIDSAGGAELWIDRGATTNNAFLGFRSAGVTEWQFADAATTKTLDIYRYVGGAYQDTPVSISNSTGDVTIANDLTANGDVLIYRNNAEVGPYFTIEQDGTGDASMQFLLTATRAWSVGIDNSDSDSLKFAPNAALDNGTALTITTGGNVTVAGALSKGSGSFKIDHPLKPDTHHLVHSFVEGPQADNIYRGKVRLINGKATVNLDQAGRMTEGTFVALNTNVQCFTSNEEGWTPLRGKVNGNMLTIEAQDETSMDEVSWLVVGERHDPHMLGTDWTDENGRVITEPLKEQ